VLIIRILCYKHSNSIATALSNSMYAEIMQTFEYGNPAGT